MSDAHPKLVGIIPARWGSTRFPGKPLAELEGKTVIERVVEKTLSAGVCDAVLVATDDDRIAQAAERAGAETRMTDPKTGQRHVAQSRSARPVGKPIRKQRRNGSLISKGMSLLCTPNNCKNSRS